MYLKFECQLEFPVLAQALCPELTEDNLDWDYENIYEWMYVDLPQLDFSLNVSREHGWANIDGETLDQYQDDDVSLKQHICPGPIYVFGWDRRNSTRIDYLPEFLSSFIADRLSVDVACFDRGLNVDIPEGQPLFVVSPTNTRDS